MLLIAFAIGWVAGMVNSIAGGGTILTFPSLLALGLSNHEANITSTMGLWPGSLGGAWAFRREVRSHRGLVWLYAAPSVAGGLVGAWLLLLTDDHTLKLLVPWLILSATFLFAAQGRLSRLLLTPAADGSHQTMTAGRWALVLPLQFLIGVYGGYFGAGIGILMLAVLGFLGMDNIHARIGVKNLTAGLINVVAAAQFAFSPFVRWPVAAAIAIGAILGAYASAGIARRLGAQHVRICVIVVGLLATAATIALYWR